MAWAYIVECFDLSYYVGSTIHLDLRVWQHNNDDTMGASYTRARRPVRLVWAAEFDRIDEAFAFEKRVQGWSRKKREALIRGDYDQLPFLSKRKSEQSRLAEIAAREREVAESGKRWEWQAMINARKEEEDGTA